MSVQSTSFRRFDARPFLLLVVALFVVSAVVSFPQSRESIFYSGSYSDLELTEHAQTAHANSKYNATTIARLFDNNYCKPKKRDCNGDLKEVHWCSLGDGVHAIGLLISKTTERIITGFRAKHSYWENMCGATA